MTWFDDLFKEYHDRKQAIFAFSVDQIVDEGIPIETYRRDWAPFAAGLHLRKDIAREFMQRFTHDMEAAKDALPTLDLVYIGEHGMDHHTFKERTTGVYYADTSYSDLDTIEREQPDLAVVEPPYWEPSYHVENRYTIEWPAWAKPEAEPVATENGL